MSTIRIKADKRKNGIRIRAGMKHPMETGKRKDKKTGEKIPAHFIQEVVGKVNGEEVITIHWGPAVSKDPYLTIWCKKGSIGDEVEVAWTDNQGNKDSKTTKVK